MSTIERPKAGEVEKRQAPELSLDGRRIRGLIPYGVESRDLGGWREVIEPTALRGANIDDLVATVDHVGVPIGRFPTTLEVEDRADGLHWSVVPPESRADVREAIERGDLRAGSWRMVVGRDEWRGQVRHVHEIAELRDVSVVSHPAYESSTVELRSAPNEEDNLSDEATTTEERGEEQRSEATAAAESDETRREAAGSLRVEGRSGPRSVRGLAEEFRSRGFPGESASVSWDEYRTATFSGAIDVLYPVRREGVALGADKRYAYPAFPTVAVDAATTSVQVLRQSARTLPSAADVIRDIDQTTTKPEVATTTELVTVSLHQVAAVETGIPNVILAQPAIDSLIETDLRLALNAGLDKLVVDTFVASPNQQSGTDPLLVSIRKALTVLQAAGYAADTLILPPTEAEELDILQTDGPEAFYVFGAGRFAPGQLFGLNVRVSKSIVAPTVVDTAAYGKLYISPISLSRFEQDAGATNKSTVRLEGHAAFGVERQDAAVEILASS